MEVRARPVMGPAVFSDRMIAKKGCKKSDVLMLFKSI